MGLKSYIYNSPSLKEKIHRLMVPRNQARPRLWVKWFVNPFFHKKGKRSKICRRTRIDVLPFRAFSIGKDTVIEDFATINNGVGDVKIGDRSRLGLGTTLIGPVTIGNDTHIGQCVILSGLNHGYEDVEVPIHKQPVSTSPIEIGDETWVGANVSIVAGVKIGKHCVVAAGSVVIKDVPSYSVVVGNPARMIKQYDKEAQEWKRV